MTREAGAGETGRQERTAGRVGFGAEKEGKNECWELPRKLTRQFKEKRARCSPANFTS